MSAVRGPAAVLSALVVAAALLMQLIGDGLYGALAVPGSLPHALAGEWPFVLAERTGLERIAAVRVTLARAALVRGEANRALVLLAPLAPTAEVVDVRGRAELAADDAPAALRDFASAGDFIAAQAAIDAIGARDPVAGLAIVRDFERRLASSASGPEIGAEAAWREGQIAALAAARYPARAIVYERAALAAYQRALARAPNEEKYLLNAALVSLVLGDAAGARTTYVRASEVVPDSVDAFVGVAVTNAVLGDCAAARTALASARGYAAEQHRVADPAAAGYAPAVRSALARCSE